MGNLYYYSSTVGLFTLQIAAGCFIPDINDVVDLIAAFAVSSLGFLFPATFYLRALKKYGDKPSVS